MPRCTNCGRERPLTPLKFPLGTKEAWCDDCIEFPRQNPFYKCFSIIKNLVEGKEVENHSCLKLFIKEDKENFKNWVEYIIKKYSQQ
jgi:hypothetical protein